MTFGKRLFDIVLSLFLGVLLFIPAIGIAIWILLSSGGPVLYRQERMSSPSRSFMLWKFRTMVTEPEDGGVTGADKHDRITPEGRILRKYRLDEIPNLWNILRGDMSFVGPRPPLRRYVERFPELYARVLSTPPGLTGLATLYFHKHEENLLRACKTAEETDKVYSTRCVPRKARLDLIYLKNRSVCADVRILIMTIKRVLGKI